MFLVGSERKLRMRVQASIAGLLIAQLGPKSFLTAFLVWISTSLRMEMDVERHRKVRIRQVSRRVALIQMPELFREHGQSPCVRDQEVKEKEEAHPRVSKAEGFNLP